MWRHFAWRAGRVGRVSDITQEQKWRFFTFAAPTPTLPHGGGSTSALFCFSVHYTKTPYRVISNLFHHTSGITGCVPQARTDSRFLPCACRLRRHIPCAQHPGYGDGVAAVGQARPVFYIQGSGVGICKSVASRMVCCPTPTLPHGGESTSALFCFSVHCTKTPYRVISNLFHHTSGIIVCAAGTHGFPVFTVCVLAASPHTLRTASGLWRWYCGGGASPPCFL